MKENNQMTMIRNENQLPKCFNKSCEDGIITEPSGVKKICPKCEKMVKDLMESEDYEVSVINGRPAGYILIKK